MKANNIRETNLDMLHDITHAPRTDPIYNAHGYLTKVPVAAILPFIETFTDEGDLVLDMFAGSGMTAIASRILGRNAIVSDISTLGKHIAEGYLSTVSADRLLDAAREVVDTSRESAGLYYKTIRACDQSSVEVVRTIWSFVFLCPACGGELIYYHELEKNDWKKPDKCSHCGGPFEKRKSKYSHDVPVRVVVNSKTGRQAEQEVSAVDIDNINSAANDSILDHMPNKVIEPDREMHKRSALKKWGLENTKSFFSSRNAAALTSLWLAIKDVDDRDIKKKLMFAFTGILPRASRRYQWSVKRPLNAANQNYYIAPVYYEWNVYQLFERKVRAIIKSDQEIKNLKEKYSSNGSAQEYVNASADELGHIVDESIDYVFTDPPFGSNIYYSDMNLFQEVWLGEFTENSREAVIHTVKRDKKGSVDHYGKILSSACREAFRVLRPGGHMSIVFGNSQGSVWSIFQRALVASGFNPCPVHISILDKGQRSVKGLNSGTENVATLDLIVTLQKPVSHEAEHLAGLLEMEPVELIGNALKAIEPSARSTPSQVYLSVLKEAMAKRVSLDALHLSDVMIELRRMGYSINAQAGLLEKVVEE